MKVSIELEVEEVQALVASAMDDYRRLEAQRDEIASKMAVVKSRIDSMNVQLHRAAPATVLRADHNHNQDQAPALIKRKAGENERVMLDYVSRFGPARAIDIVKNTGVGVSSVQAVLIRKPSKFTKLDDGRWAIAQ